MVSRSGVDARIRAIQVQFS